MQADGPFRARFSSSPSTIAEPQPATESRFKVFPGPHKRVELPSPGTTPRAIVDYVGTGKRVLELGCGTGALSKVMSDLGCRVTGVDLDPKASAVAASACEDVVVLDLDATVLGERFAGDAFDAIVFDGVLEHLRNPWRILDQARALLEPSGYVVLSIPNVAHGSMRLSLLGGSFPHGSQGSLDDARLRFFTLRSIRELCLTAGYRIDAIERTKVALFTEHDALPAVREKSFGAEVVEQIKSDPEHDTLDFVVKATPIPDELRFHYAVGEFFAVEAERDEAIAALRDLRESVPAEIEKAVAEASVSSDQVDRSELALRSARSRVKELEASLAQVKSEMKDLSAEFATALDRFLRYAESELFAARTQAQELDAAIVAIKKSPFWFPKRVLQKLRRR